METRRNTSISLDSLRVSLQNVGGREAILAFVETLMGERDELAKRQEHLHSLARLYEKTVSDADELAEQIKKEAAEAAQSQAKGIIDQAEQKSRLLLEETRSQVLLEAQDEVSAMRAGAERDLQASFRLQAAMFQSHVRETAERLHREMLAQAEECARRLSAFEAELEKGLSCLPIPAVKSEEAQHSQDGVIDAVRAAIADQASSPGTDSTPLHHGIETDPREKTVEIKILPPRDKDAIEAIGAYLNRLDEVAAADVVHMTDMTVIRVLLLQPIDLAVRLSGLREVESAREVNEGDSEKIEVVLSVRSELEREREALNTKAHRLATRISRNEEVKRSSPH